MLHTPAQQPGPTHLEEANGVINTDQEEWGYCRLPSTPDAEKQSRGGLKPAASGLHHLLGSYDDDSEEGEGLTEVGVPDRTAAKGEDLDDKVKDFLAELETDGLLQEGIDGAAEKTLAASSAEIEQPAKHTDAGINVEVPAAPRARAVAEDDSSRNDKQPEKDEEEEVFAEEGWQAVLDLSSGEHYYWNTISRQTTWDKPTTRKRRKAGEAGLAGDKVGDQDLATSGTPAAEEAGDAASNDRLQTVHSEGEAAPSSGILAGADDGEEYLAGGDQSFERAPALGQKGSVNAIRSSSAEANEGPLDVDAGSGPAGRAVEEGDTEMEAAPKELQTSTEPERGESKGGSADSGSMEWTDKGNKTEALGGGQVRTQAADREEAENHTGGSPEEAGPDMKGQLVVVSEGDQAAVLDTDSRSSEQRALVDSVLEEGEALVERLHDRAGVHVRGVTPLARLAIQAEALTNLAWRLQGQDSLQAVWAKIREQLLQLSVHAAEAEHASSQRAQDTLVEASEQGKSAGPAPQGQSEEDIEALLDDVDMGQAEGPASRENGSAASRLFPIDVHAHSEPQHMASGGLWHDDPTADIVGRGPQFRSAGDLAPSKAELLRQKTLALQQRLAAIQAFQNPAHEPPAEKAILSGLAGYGSSGDEIEEGEFVASKDQASSRLPGSDDPAVQQSVPQGEPMQIEAQPPQDAAVYPPQEATAGTSYEAGAGHVTYQYPSYEYDSTTTAPAPPEAAYDPFADLQPPLPSSPPPADTWQAEPPPPPAETLPDETVPVPIASIEAPPEASEPPKPAQGPVLSAPPVRIARPVEAVPPAGQSRAAAAAAAAAAAKKVKARKAAAPVGLGVSSAKKVSSLLDKWKAASQDSTERPATPEEVERKKAQELEEWRRQQIVSGQADKNANFAPVEGDWRKRVEKAKKQADKQARRSRAASADYPDVKVGKPDLAALAEGLPPGWKPFLDPSSGDVYYGNLKTSETSWERPGGT